MMFTMTTTHPHAAALPTHPGRHRVVVGLVVAAALGVGVPVAVTALAAADLARAARARAAGRPR